MTVSATNNYDLFTPNGVSLVFGFTFHCDDAAWVYGLLDGVSVGGFTVLLNVDQSTSPGGTVTFAVAPSGALLVIGRNTALTQNTAYDPYSRFPADSHEKALDKPTMQVQDFAEIAGRTAQYPIGTDPADQVQEFPAYDADKVWAWHPTLPGVIVNVVNPAVAAAASASAASGSASAASGSAAAAAASYDSFDDRYLGPKASDPALDNDGNALLAGALYWNTTSSVFKVYGGAAWTSANTLGLPVSIPNGGTGQITAGGARAALGAVGLTGDETIAGAKTLSNLLILTVGQIKFPAAQNASADANTLDDYEEGTWTPEINFGSGNTGITYSTQYGNYIKIGKLVVVWAVIVLTNKGSSTGVAQLVNLPFTIARDAGASIGHFANITYTGSLVGFVSSSNVAINLEKTTEAGSNSAIANTNFANNSEITVAAHYQF